MHGEGEATTFIVQFVLIQGHQNLGEAAQDACPVPRRILIRIHDGI